MYLQNHLIYNYSLGTMERIILNMFQNLRSKMAIKDLSYAIKKRGNIRLWGHNGAEKL